MPADIIATLREEAQPTDLSNVKYVNPQTGTKVFVNPDTLKIVGIQPRNFKD